MGLLSSMNKELPEETIAPQQSSFKFDIYYAEAWARRQGRFSFDLAHNVIRYLKSKQINVKSILDICSGSGEFISIMRNICTDCVGVDNADGYLNYVHTRYGDINFEKVEKLYSFDLKRKFNFISCNRDVVNMFVRWSEWEEFFKTVYKHLTKNGILMFDFYSEKKLKDWSELIYEQGDGLDYVSNVFQNNGYCIMNETYYLKETSALTRKTGDIMVEAGFSTEKIIDGLKVAGFNDVKVVDYELNPVSDYSLMDRIHILATK